MSPSERKSGSHAKVDNRAPQVRLKLPDGRSVRVPVGTPIGEALKHSTKQPQSPAIAALWNNKITSLDRRIDSGGEVDFVDMRSRDGGLIFRRSLTYLLIRALAELFPDLKVHINHSLNGGYYAELYDERLKRGEPVTLAATDIERLKLRMQEIIDANEPFERIEVTREEAIRTFTQRGMMDKVSLLKYRTDEKVSIYRFGNLVNHFYGQLAPSAGFLKPFDIHICSPGIVLYFPKHGAPGGLPEYHHNPKLFNIFQEYERWSRILGLRTVAQLNDLIETQQIREFLLIAEALHEKKLAAIADTITNSPRRPRIVLLSGPSSSGKTTTVKRLSVHLRVNGARPLVISLDNFFVPREQTPRDENGDYDFESFKAIDVEALQSLVRRLLHGEAVRVPHFDFQAGRSVPGAEVRLEEGQPLILEGIHGLNTNLIPTVPDGLKFKIYVSPLTHLNIDDHNRIASSDARLIRRIVRDSRYRGYSALDTIKRWPSVRRGEERNIFPYQEEADVIFNSALPYEMCILRQFAIPLLEKLSRKDREYSEAARLLKFLGYFKDIKIDYVPRHSLLREFVGGSSFKY